MDIQAEKELLINMILQTDDKSILDKVKQFFVASNKNDFWNTLSTEDKEEIEAGIIDINNGNVVDYKSYMSKHR